MGFPEFQTNLSGRISFDMWTTLNVRKISLDVSGSVGYVIP